MNIEKQLNIILSYKYYLIAIGSIILLIIVIIFMSMSRSEPTLLEDISNADRTNLIGESSAPAEDQREEFVSFTGYMDEESPSIQDTLVVEQSNDLRELVPIDTSLFTIDFNYQILKFEVSLKEDVNESHASFESWKNENYSEVPIDMFVIK